MQIFNHLQKLFPFFLINSREVPLFDSFFNIPFNFFFFFFGNSLFFNSGVDYFSFEVRMRFIFRMYFFLLKLHHLFMLLHSLSSLLLSIISDLFILFFMLFDCLDIGLEQGMPFTKNFLSFLILLLGISTIVVLL